MFLEISMRTWGERLWPAHQITEAPHPTVDPVASVGSYAEARERASSRQYLLRVHADAWAEMVEAGVAPVEVPAGVILV